MGAQVVVRHASLLREPSHESTRIDAHVGKRTSDQLHDRGPTGIWRSDLKSAAATRCSSDPGNGAYIEVHSWGARGTVDPGVESGPVRFQACARETVGQAEPIWSVATNVRAMTGPIAVVRPFDDTGTDRIVVNVRQRSRNVRLPDAPHCRAARSELAEPSVLSVHPPRKW